MRGVVIVPTFYKKRQSMGAVLKRQALYNNLCKKYNFLYLHTDVPNLDGYDIAIIVNRPYHNNPIIPPGLLDANCKLIGDFADLQCWGKQRCIKNKEILFNRYDLLIGGYYEKFRERYPQHVHKYIHWPQYFGPYERYIKLPINTNPKMRCLLIGSFQRSAYPLRNYIARAGKKGLIDTVGAHRVPFLKYPKYLNKYFCGLAISGRFNALPAKYFEIPAAGTLMLAREVEELAICGLKPHVHYVPITKENVFDQVKEVLAHPDDYIEIRDRGTKFVRENHSDLNRLDMFREIFNRLWSDGNSALLR